MKPNKYFVVSCTEDSFYRAWMEFTTPYHKLTMREKDVAARILTQFARFQEKSDPEVLYELLWSRKSRRDIMESLGMSRAHFQMVLANLKASGFLKSDGSINSRYIPTKSDDSPRFMLQVVFDWSSSKNPINREAEQEGA